MSGSFSYVFDTPGDYYLRSTSASSMRLHIHVVDCQFCHVISGYAGTDPAALSLAVSARTAGDYSLSFDTRAVLGFFTVYANQTVTIAGHGAPIGQLPLLDASITVQAGGHLVLNAVQVSADVSVDAAATIQSFGSLVQALPQSLAVPIVDGGPDAAICSRERAGSLAFATSAGGAAGQMVMCYPDVERWGPLATGLVGTTFARIAS